MASWWNSNVEKRIRDFISWTGGFNQPSKVHCRNYIVKNQYKSVIDCGCGLATDYFGFKHDGHEIDYTGLDSCKYLIKYNIDRGMKMIDAELTKKLPIKDNSYECVYCREVLEHLPYYEKTLKEFVRIATKEVIVVFFIKPLSENEWEAELNSRKEKMLKEFREEIQRAWDRERKDLIEGIIYTNRLTGQNEPLPEPGPVPNPPDPVFEIKDEEKEINYWRTEDLYHNKYDKKKLETFILGMDKVDRIFWEGVDDFGYVTQIENEGDAGSTVKPTTEATSTKFILHIILKQPTI